MSDPIASATSSSIKIFVKVGAVYHEASHDANLTESI